MASTLVLILALALAVQADDDMRVLTVAQVATTVYSHACVDGTVTQRRREHDGDWHLRVEAGGAFLVAEIIPQIPLSAPKKGTRVRVCGVTRYDKLHRWPELHPVLTIRALEGKP